VQVLSPLLTATIIAIIDDSNDSRQFHVDQDRS